MLRKVLIKEHYVHQVLLRVPHKAGAGFGPIGRPTLHFKLLKIKSELGFLKDTEGERLVAE